MTIPIHEAPISEPGNHGGGITRTLIFWESRTPQALTAEDAREMVEAVAGFFSQLGAWDEPKPTSNGDEQWKG